MPAGRVVTTVPTQHAETEQIERESGEGKRYTDDQVVAIVIPVVLLVILVMVAFMVSMWMILHWKKR